MTGHDPLGPVTITPRDIYDQLVALRSAVERLIDADADNGRRLDDHETRLRAGESVVQDVRGLPARVAELERNRWPAHLLSILIAAAALAAAVFLKK